VFVHLTYFVDIFYNSELYVVTGSSTIEVYRMDGQDGVFTKTYGGDYIMTSLVIDYSTNDVYCMIDDENNVPHYLARIDHNLTDWFTVINFIYSHFPRTQPPFALLDSIYLVQDGINTYFKKGAIQCIDPQVIGQVHSAKAMHYDRQPGKHYIHCILLVQ